MRFRISRIAFLLVVAFSLPAIAQTNGDTAAKPEEKPAEEPPKWDEFPPIEAYQRVGIKKRYDGPRYNDMRKCIRGMRSKVKARYYAGMVDITDPKGYTSRKLNDANPYAKSMFKAWQDSPAKVDAETGIVLVMGLRNRSIGVHAGSKWQKIGLTDQAIKDTIAGSDWGSAMRRYDLNEAMCAVANAVDFKLVNLQRQMDRRIENAKAEAPKVEAELAEAQKSLVAMFPQKHTYGDKLKGELEQAVKDVEAAKSKLETEPVDAVELFDKARDEMKSVAEKQEEYKTAIKELEAAEEELKTAKVGIGDSDSASSEHGERAMGKIQECEKIAQTYRDTLEGSPGEVRDCMREAQIESAKGEVHHHYQAGVIPKAIATTAAALFALFVLAFFLRRRRALKVVDPDIREWDTLLGWAAVKLSKIQTEYETYLQPREPWQGEAAEIDYATISKLNRAFLLQKAGQEILNQAKAKRASSSFNVFGLDKTARILRDSPVDFAPGTVDERCAVVINSEGYSGKAYEVKADLATALTEAVGLLSQVDRYVKKIDEDIQIALKAASGAQEAVAARQGLQLPVNELNAALEQHMATLQQGQQLISVDPVQAAKVLEKASKDLVALQERAEAGNDVVREVRQSLVGLGAKLRKVLAKLASKGNVVEDKFDPQAVLDGGSVRVDEILAKVNKGKEIDAREAMEELAEDLKGLRTKLAVRAEAPKLIPVMQETMASQRDEVNGLILKIRMAIQKAEPEIQQSYNPYLDKLTEYQRVLAKVQRTNQQIDKFVADGKYMAATGALKQLIEPYAEGLAMVAQLVETTGVGTGDHLVLPADWANSVTASWDASEFEPPQRGTGRFAR